MIELGPVPGPVVPENSIVPAIPVLPIVPVEPAMPLVPDVPVVPSSVGGTVSAGASSSSTQSGSGLDVSQTRPVTGNRTTVKWVVCNGPEPESEETPYVPESESESDEEYGEPSHHKNMRKKRKRESVATRSKKARTRTASLSSVSLSNTAIADTVRRKSGTQEACRSRETIPYFTTSEEERSDVENNKSKRSQIVSTEVKEVQGSSTNSGLSSKGKSLKGKGPVSLNKSKSSRSGSVSLGSGTEPGSFHSMVPVLHRLDERSDLPTAGSQSSVSTVSVSTGSAIDLTVESSPGSSVSIRRKKLQKKIPGNRWVAKGVVPHVRIPFAPRSSVVKGCKSCSKIFFIFLFIIFN